MIEVTLQPGLCGRRYLYGDWSCDVRCLVQYLLHVPVYFACTDFSFLTQSVSLFHNMGSETLTSGPFSRVDTQETSVVSPFMVEVALAVYVI